MNEIQLNILPGLLTILPACCVNNNHKNDDNNGDEDGGVKVEIK